MVDLIVNTRQDKSIINQELLANIVSATIRLAVQLVTRYTRMEGSNYRKALVLIIALCAVIIVILGIVIW